MEQIDEALTICYFLAFGAAVLKAIRYWADFKRTEQRFMLLGFIASVALALALGLIAISAGPNPIWSGFALKIGIRLSIIVYALFSLAFEVIYATTFVSVVKD